MNSETDFTIQSIFDRIEDRNPIMGGALLEEGSNHIVLMRDHDETEVTLPAYYEKILDYCMEQGVDFIEPKFK